MTIFINYRRDDTSAIAGRIDDHLRRAFGRSAVYRDIDSIPLGTPFADHIRAEVSGCRVFLVIMGKHWVSQRLQDEGDFVRLEIEVALERSIPVIPVLVEGAMLPTAAELPASLRPLLLRQGMPVDSGSDFHLHVERLIKGVQQLLETAPRVPRALPSLGKARQASSTVLAAIHARRWRWGIPLAIAGFGMLLALRLLHQPETSVLALDGPSRAEPKRPLAGSPPAAGEAVAAKEPLAGRAGAPGSPQADPAPEPRGAAGRAGGAGGSGENPRVGAVPLERTRPATTAPERGQGKAGKSTSALSEQGSNLQAPKDPVVVPSVAAVAEPSCGTLEAAGFTAGGCLVAGEACPQWYTLQGKGAGPMQLRALSDPAQRGCALRAQGQNLIDWGGFAGFHFLTPEGKPARYDASRFTGLGFWARGWSDPHGVPSLRIEIATASQVEQQFGGDCLETAAVHCYDYWRANIDLTEDWVFHSLPFAQFRQGDWGKKEAVFDPRKLLGVNFVARGAADFWIDDVTLTPR